MPYIVVIIDEFGDLILTAGKEVEMPITRIAQFGTCYRYSHGLLQPSDQQQQLSLVTSKQTSLDVLLSVLER